MRRLWLLFAQTVTIALGLYMVVQGMQPGWLAGVAPRLQPIGPAMPVGVLQALPQSQPSAGS